MENCNLSDVVENNTEVVYASVSLSSLFLVVGSPLNAIMIGIVIKKKLLTRPSVMLMMNLAIANLLVCLLVMPLTIAYGIQVLADKKGCTLTGILCQTAVIFSLLPLVSTYVVALMAVDRVIYLKKPLRYERIVTPCKMFAAILGVWLFSFITLIALIILNGLLPRTELYDNLLCFPFSIAAAHSYLTIVLGLLIFSPEIVELVCCVYIIYIARRHLLRRFHGMLSRFGSVRVQTQSATKDKVQKGREKEYKKGQLQIVKLFAAFFTTSFLTAIAAFAFGLVGSNVFSLLSYLTILSRSILLPLMEVYLTHEVRSAILNTFFARCGGTHTHCCKR